LKQSGLKKQKLESTLENYKMREIDIDNYIVFEARNVIFVRRTIKNCIITLYLTPAALKRGATVVLKMLRAWPFPPKGLMKTKRFFGRCTEDLSNAQSVEMF